MTAVGPGGRDESGKLIPIDIKVGDKVLFGKWSGTEVKLDGEDTPDHEAIRHHGRARLSINLPGWAVRPSRSLGARGAASNHRKD